MDKDTKDTLILLGGLTGLMVLGWYLFKGQTASALYYPTCDEVANIPPEVI